MTGLNPGKGAHRHHQGDDQSPKHLGPQVVPLGAQQGNQKQQHREDGREQAEEAKRLNDHHHQHHQTDAEHSHGQAQGHEQWPCGAVELPAVLLGHQQGRHSHHQHRGIGQKAEQRQGLSQHRGPRAIKHDVASVPRDGAGQLRHNLPPFEGDEPCINSPDRGQDSHHQTGPSVNSLVAVASGRT